MRVLINKLLLLLLLLFKLFCCALYQKSKLPHPRRNELYMKNVNPNLLEEIKVRNNYLQTYDDMKKIKQMKMKKERALRSGGDYKSKIWNENSDKRKDIGEEVHGYHKDPVLNMWARRKSRYDDTDSESSSSSLEMYHWKEEWRNVWLKKKLEALNSSVPAGDTVNMAAARPWGVPCGDPNQHDMPWGTCMLPMECEAEFRIYRGDISCGRTQFVCCALQLTGYDMYEGFDVSFAETSLETDTEEKKWRDMSSREKRNKKRRREKRKRKRDRLKRKRKIKKNIRNIIREMKKILDRAYRNGTSKRKRKTKQLKRFIKELKKQYRKDRQSVKDIHEMEMIKVDAGLMKKLNQIRALNRNFARNSTFRDIIVNGTMNKRQARMLMEAYPELEGYIVSRRSGVVNRLETDYDIEYGYLYY